MDILTTLLWFLVIFSGAAVTACLITIIFIIRSMKEDKKSHEEFKQRMKKQEEDWREQREKMKERIGRRKMK